MPLPARLGFLLATVVLALVLGGPVAAEEGETQLGASADGKHRLHLPADWGLEPFKVGGAALALKCTIPGTGKSVDVVLFDLVRAQLTPRAQVYLERPVQERDYRATSAVSGLDPLAHVLVHYEEGESEKSALFIFTRQKGHGLHLRCVADSDIMLKVREACFAIAKTIEADVDHWPPAPKGYDLEEHEGFRFYAAPLVRPKDIDRTRKVILDVQKRFEKFHGKIVRPDDEPATVIVHRDKTDAKAINEYVSEYESSSLAMNEERQIFIGMMAYEGESVDGAMAWAAVDLFLSERYSTYLPTWIQRGEMWLASNRVRTGKKGAVVSRRWYAAFQGVQHNISDLAAIEKPDWSAYTEHGRAYILLFHFGPLKYRKAYKAFLEMVDRTGDYEVAMVKHLYALDLDDMRKDADKFIRKKVKGVTTK